MGTAVSGNDALYRENQPLLALCSVVAPGPHLPARAPLVNWTGRGSRRLPIYLTSSSVVVEATGGTGIRTPQEVTHALSAQTTWGLVFTEQITGATS